MPEGITTDCHGGLYVSLGFLGEVWRLNPVTGEKGKVADVPGGALKGTGACEAWAIGREVAPA